MNYLLTARVARKARTPRVYKKLGHNFSPKNFLADSTTVSLQKRSCHDSLHSPKQVPIQDVHTFAKGPTYERWHSMKLATSSDLRKLLNQTTSEIYQDAKLDRRLLSMWALSLSRAFHYTTLRTPLAAFSRFLSQPPAGMSRPFRPARFAHILHTLRDDIARARNHSIPIPWDLSTRYIRPSLTAAISPVADAALLIRELTAMGMRMWRESRQSESGVIANNYTETPVWMDGSIYPDYYKRPFHYQSDGWMSSRSAATYNTLTEMLFDGCQDSMQRLAVSEVYARFRSHDRPAIVELAAGTGKVATHVRHFLPRAQLTVTDLSPFFLEYAKNIMLQWENAVLSVDKMRRVDVRFTQANAAHLPMEDASVDCIYVVYLLHELPADARRAVFKEAARVLKPNGVFVVADAVQNGDRLGWGTGGKSFTRFGEPWFNSYYDDRIEKLGLEENLFKPGTVDLCSFTKMVSFIRAVDEKTLAAD